jgi:hypothetical protein
MAFNPYSNSNAEIYAQNRFGSQNAFNLESMANVAQGVIGSRSQVEAAQRVAEYRKRQEEEEEKGGIFGAIGTGLGAVAGSLFGAPQVGAAIGGSIGRSIA